VHEFHGSVVVIKASGEDTLGQLGVMEFGCPPGLRVHRHVHDGEDEMFCLLAGERTGSAVTVGGRRGRVALCPFPAASGTASPSPAASPPRLWSSPGHPALTARSRRAEHRPAAADPTGTAAHARPCGCRTAPPMKRGCGGRRNGVHRPCLAAFSSTRHAWCLRRARFPASGSVSIRAAARASAARARVTAARCTVPFQGSAARDANTAMAAALARART
jgi:hypothetical protein